MSYVIYNESKGAEVALSLRKYARPRKENLTEQYTVRLTKADAELFEAYCREINISPAEAFRLLVQEELQREGLEYTNQEVSVDTQDEVKIESTETLSDIKKTSRKSLKKSSRAKGEVSKFLAGLRIEGQLPCPVCKTWSSAGHFSGRHAKKHGFSSTYEFLKAYEEDVKQMYQEHQNEK
jgi:hypothetical protein